MQKRRGCLGCLGGCATQGALALAVGCMIVWVLMAPINPWALHIGGRSTPLLYWHGVGTVRSKDGKAYPVYVTFFPGRPQRHLIGRREGKRWAADLTGAGWLCVAPGNQQRMKLSGTMYGDNGNAAEDLFEFRVLEWSNPLFFNSIGRGFFDLAGQWHGDDLVMDRPNEQGIRLKSGILIDGATAMLHWGNKGEFDGACGR